jgi:transcriptional regulator
MEKLLKELIGRVEVLIKLQVLTAFKDASQTDRIMALHSMGLTQAEIASILGTKLNNVTATVSRVTKGRNKTKTKKESSKGE